MKYNDPDIYDNPYYIIEDQHNWFLAAKKTVLNVNYGIHQNAPNVRKDITQKISLA